MKTIHKYQLESADFQVIEVPVGAKFLHANFQHDRMCVWALVDNEAAMERRRIRIIGTGLPADDISVDQYIGSILVLNGTYVFHIFDVGVAVQ